MKRDKAGITGLRALFHLSGRIGQLKRRPTSLAAFFLAVVTCAVGAVGSTPMLFFVGIKSILIEVGTDPIAQTTISKERVANTARDILIQGLRSFDDKISVEAVSLNDDRKLAPNTLTVSINISIRDLPLDLDPSGGRLLATSVTLIRTDLPVPIVIPPRFLIPAEPLIVQSNASDIQVELRKIIEAQLRRGVVVPIMMSNVRRQ